MQNLCKIFYENQPTISVNIECIFLTIQNGYNFSPRTSLPTPTPSCWASTTWTSLSWPSPWGWWGAPLSPWLRRRSIGWGVSQRDSKTEGKLNGRSIFHVTIFDVFWTNKNIKSTCLSFTWHALIRMWPLDDAIMKWHNLIQAPGFFSKIRYKSILLRFNNFVRKQKYFFNQKK